MITPRPASEVEAIALINRAFGLDRPRRPVAPITDVTKASGFSPMLGAIYSPADTTKLLAARLEAQGVGIVWEDGGGFRTMTPAEKAAAASTKAA